MPSWLATTASVIAGGMLAIIAAWLADRRLTARERERRNAERHERLVIRRNEFQRETLLALQIASQKLLRTAGAMHHQDVIASRKTGQWQRQQFAVGLADEYLHQNTDTMLLATRVCDEGVRTLANSLREQASLVSISSHEAEAESRLMAAGDTQAVLIQRIGQLLRDLDEIE